MTDDTIPEPNELNDDLGFSYRVGKDGLVLISWNGKQVTILRGDEAQKFLARIESLDPAGEQQLMARATGNFKRGNERKAGQHRRNQ
ncbi:MAG: hypothetical protein SH847_23150 [Roseiflexaceae bacterium]|nr:hypothetical protein [Roseiflexaceae bacterium]